MKLRWNQTYLKRLAASNIQYERRRVQSEQNYIPFHRIKQYIKRGEIIIKYTFETIRYDDNLPAKIEITDCPACRCRKEAHWHKELEFIYVLDGSVAVTKSYKKTELNADDIFLINSSEIHEIDAVNADENAKLLTLYVSYEFIRRFDSEFDAIRYQIDRGTQAEKRLKELMLELVSATDSTQEFPAVKQYALLMDIIHVLFEQCRREKRISLYGSCRVSFRNAKLAMEYIEEHYREDINLNVMAQLVGLNPIYFSKYFKESTGLGFNSYLGSVRLKHAIDDLLGGNMSIADAAKYNGFPNVKSFETACKRCYGLTPLQFKKQQLRVS